MSSPSLLSEPLDIRNVFSSYTYQSPELDSNEDFCVSPTRVGGGECDDKGLCVEDSEDRVESRKSKRTCDCGTGCINKNGCHSIARESTEDAEISACHESLSLPSEPPDIANWFSSYAYESPELDTADFDVSLSPIDNSENVDKESLELYKALTVKADNESVSRGPEMKATVPIPKNCEKCSTAQVHISEKNVNCSENNLCSEVTSEASTQAESLGDCRSTADEFVLCRRLNTENLTPIMQKEVQTNDTDQPLIISKTCSKEEAFAETCENVKQNISHISNNDSGWIKLNRKSHDPYYKGSKPDGKQYAHRENGATSSMMNTTPRVNNENRHPMLGTRNTKVENNVTESFSSGENKRAKHVTREVFKETTNIQHPYAHESAGKWRCPQKNKPNTGPPLKQLRLERWVRRI